MKVKKFLILTVIVSMISFCLLCTACVDKTSTKYIDEYYNKINKSQSGTIEMVLDYGELGAYSVTMKHENNKTYQSAFLGEEPYFTEEIDGYIYTYTKQGASWIRDNGVAKDSEVTGFDEFAKLFKGENYEYSKAKACFVLKDNVLINFSGVTLSNSTMEIKDDVCIIKSLATMQGTTGAMTLNLYDINKTTVILPSIT